MLSAITYVTSAVNTAHSIQSTRTAAQSGAVINEGGFYMKAFQAERLRAAFAKVTAAKGASVSPSLQVNSICIKAEKIENKWRAQDLQFARLLKEYGCTEIYRPWPERLIMFVGGEPYNLPASVCFKGIEPGNSYGIGELISVIEGEIE